MVPRARVQLSPSLRALRSPSAGLLAQRQAARSLISLAGLVGQPVVNPDGSEVGRVVDVVARWQGEPYPSLTGLVARVGRRRTFVPAAALAELTTPLARLSSARLDLVDFVRRDGEVLLAQDVLDHQLVDVDGVQVIRAADLYLARVGLRHRLVGVDVGVRSLVRRLGPRRWRARATPDRVIDWSVIQPLGGGGGAVHLTRSSRELHRLRPSEIADLLEELGRGERQDLLGALSEETAADALEEMEPSDVVALLREVPVDRAAALLAEMEPDEAVDVLRDLDRDQRRRFLAAMEPGPAAALVALLRFRPHTAGGLMTTVMVTIAGHRTVDDVRRDLRDHADHRLDIDAVLVVDADGRVLDDITLFELLMATADQTMLELIGEPWPVTITADTPLDEIVEALRDNRRSSIVVVDDDGRPVGRILGDDLIDAIAPNPRQSRFSRLPA